MHCEWSRHICAMRIVYCIHTYVDLHYQVYVALHCVWCLCLLARSILRGPRPASSSEKFQILQHTMRTSFAASMSSCKWSINVDADHMTDMCVTAHMYCAVHIYACNDAGSNAQKCSCQELNRPSGSVGSADERCVCCSPNKSEFASLWSPSFCSGQFSGEHISAVPVIQCLWAAGICII